MILFVGASSRVGMKTIPILVAKGYEVRAMTRKPEKCASLAQLGVEVVPGDLRDPASLVRACAGIDQVIASAHGMNPDEASNNPHTVDELGHHSLIDAAKAAGVKHFIFISILGVTPNNKMDLFRIKYATEQYLIASRMSYTILRAAAFMEFWAAMVGEPVLKTGKTTIFGRGNNPINFVSAQDVAKFIVIALEDPRACDQIIEVGGPENLSFNQVANIFAKIKGSPVQINHIPLPVMRVMRILTKPFKPMLSLQITGGIQMDTENQSFDMRPILGKYPIELVRLEEVAHQMANSQ